MIIRKFIFKNTGNSLSDYTEEVYECDKCKGSGSIHIDRKDLLDTMEGLNFFQAIHVYRQWKAHDKTVHCPECEGHGEHTFRY